MAEEKWGGIRGWIKASLTSAFGLVSGAVLMYLTPLVDSFIKPAKPVANFATQVQGLSVTFNNRSLGGTQGWWDFGDGSALEPFAPTQETVSHTYPHAGNYTVKLSVQNLLGDINERDIPVNIDPGTAPKPEIVTFEVAPALPGSTGTPVAPAIFRIQTQVKNATTCIWSLGDNRPLEITSDTSGRLDRLVTFKKPGKHVVRLVAVNGKQTEEKSQILVIDSASPSAAGAASATLKVTYDAMALERQTLLRNVSIPWTAAHKESNSPFEVTRLLDETHKDYLIQSANVVNKEDPRVRNPQVEISPDKTRFILRGDLTHPTHWWNLNKQAPPPWVAEVALQLERRSRVQPIAMDDLPVGISVPGTTTIPIPRLSDGYQMTQKHLHLELRDGNNVIWSGDQPPTNAVLKMGNQQVIVSAVERADGLVLDVHTVVPTGRPLGN
jgi:PKD repeat protein